MRQAWHDRRSGNSLRGGELFDKPTEVKIQMYAADFAALLNEGLEPGVRVVLDDDTHQTATVCSAEKTSPYTRIRLDRTGTKCRVATWRLACLS